MRVNTLRQADIAYYRRLCEYTLPMGTILSLYTSWDEYTTLEVALKKWQKMGITVGNRGVNL